MGPQGAWKPHLPTCLLWVLDVLGDDLCLNLTTAFAHLKQILFPLKKAAANYTHLAGEFRKKTMSWWGVSFASPSAPFPIFHKALA